MKIAQYLYVYVCVYVSVCVEAYNCISGYNFLPVFFNIISFDNKTFITFTHQYLGIFSIYI